MVCLLNSTTTSTNPPLIMTSTTTTTCSSTSDDMRSSFDDDGSEYILDDPPFNTSSSNDMGSSCNIIKKYNHPSYASSSNSDLSYEILKYKSCDHPSYASSNELGSCNMLKYNTYNPSYASKSSSENLRYSYDSDMDIPPLINGCTYSKLTIPLEALQGTWISSFGNEVLKVDLLWIYIRNIKCKKSLRLHHGNWRWMGWDLKRISIIDRRKILFWKHDREDREIVWRQHENVPKLQCLKLDVKGTDPISQKAHALLNRAFVLSEPVRDHEGAEMYALQYEGSIEGPFAASIIVRDSVNLLIYFATRAPLQGLGYGKVLLERIMSTTREDTHDADANRWIAVIRKKTKLKKCDSTGWWNAQSFVKDVSEELDHVNPFNDCVLLEYTKENTAKRRRISSKRSTTINTTCSTTEGSRSDRSDSSI